MRIIYVPIEPLEERYTKSWYHNIFKFFAGKGMTRRIEGHTLQDTVKVGTFLDINSTVAYKAAQLQHIADMFDRREIKNGDMFFFGDVEFWGLESVRLMAQMNHVDVKIFGFLHAGSYTKEDAFAVAADYQQYTEVGWLRACDKVFVGSEYHKQALYERRIVDRFIGGAGFYDFSERVVVTGNPLFESDYTMTFEERKVAKRDQVIISNRFDWEKRPNMSLNFAYLLKKRNPNLRIVVTTSRKEFKSNRQWLVDYARAFESDGVIEIREGLTKEQYHKELAMSKVMLSNTIEENFGYCVVEACLYDCAPIVPNAFSHPEILRWDRNLLYDNEDEIIPKVEACLYGPEGGTRGSPRTHHGQLRTYASKYFDSMERIWDAMTGRRTLMAREG